ncbi:hypothetical protein D3C76_1871410 [compost metagenome]
MAGLGNSLNRVRRANASSAALGPVVPQGVVTFVLVADDLVAKLGLHLAGVDGVEPGGEFLQR